ncbi:MAG: hypothetical protein L0H41_07585 [Microlunatus sp.]|nr:hypothetical protein [Microlunatus sp.]MDN5771723.1 hypothetical protein [Microlunatus sp.]MDN5804226.1 hypothetical protein [Microlunatus sp.]
MATPYEFADRTDAELDAVIRAAIAELADRGTTSAFATLIELSALLGTSLGDAARRVAETGSWSQVAQVSGTTKQAAWSRWR